MPQVPFPHVLSSKKELSEGILRVVTDVLASGNRVIEYDRKEWNKTTNQMESVYSIYRFDTIEEISPAKGTWTNWSVHPTYFKGTGRYIEQLFESQLN